MLPPEPAVIAARYDIDDAQELFLGSTQPLGSFNVCWYGTDTQDEIGSFGLVNPTGPLATYVGDYLQVRYQGLFVTVYIIGSSVTLPADIGLTRRSFLAVSRLTLEPLYTPVLLVS
jgi:hypothetical protein